MGIQDLANDVMWDVLSRLDFKTLSCCQCVCKRWRHLVLDPYFITNNLLWSNNKNPILLIHDTTLVEPGRLKWIQIQDKVVEVENEQLVDAVTIHDVDMTHLGDLNGFDHRLNIRQTVNGLIPTSDMFGNTYIVNPIAEQYLTLPKHQSTITSLGYGFGSLDDASYKVINIGKRFLTRACEDEIIQIEVFTLGTNSWRVLPPNDHLKNIRDDMGAGLFFYGHVHWINTRGHQLFAFDFDNETFNVFPSPPFEGEEKQPNYSGILGVLKGCLSQGCYYDSSKVFTVWVMKQHGIKDSWYKACTIKDTSITCKLSRPLCLFDGLKGGTLIAGTGHKLVAYCLKTNTLRTINYTSSAIDIIVSVSTYHPTFLNLQKLGLPKNTSLNLVKIDAKKTGWISRFACSFTKLLQSL